MCLDKFDVSSCLAQVSVNKENIAIRSVLRMDNRRDNRPLREAMEEQYVWLDYRLGREVTSVFRLIQTLLGFS